MMWWFEQTVESFRGFNISSDLGLDEAWLNISSSFDQPLWLYILSYNCHECPFQKLLEEAVLPAHSYKAKVSTRHGSILRFRTSGNSSSSHYAPDTNDSSKLCDIPTNFGEFGVYSIHAGGSRCSLKTDLEPVNIYSSLFAVFGFWLLLCILWLNWGDSLGKAVEKARTYFFRGRRSHVENEALLNDNQSPVMTNPCSSDSSDGNEGSSLSSSSSKGKRLSREEGGGGDDGSTRAPPSPTLNKTDAPKRGRRRSKRKSGKQIDKSQVSSCPKPEPAASSSSCSSSASPLVLVPVPVVQQQQQKERLKSLDVFRGLSIIIMIFADDGGGGYYFFQHCTWDGLYVADLAFPWFLWICGVCIPFSLNSKILHGSSPSKSSIFLGILERSLKLIMLGLIVNTSSGASAVQLESLRFPGVLQRFGVAYLIGSTLYLLLCGEKVSSHQSQEQDQTSNSWNYHHFQDLKVSLIPWLIVMLCVTLHTCLIFLLPVPNCPTGYLGPGGLHRNNTISGSCVGGAAGYMDRLIFGLHHIHSRPTSQRTYGSGAFDPEGSLGIFTSIFQVWLGVHTGIILLLYKSAHERLSRFLGWSIFLGLVGGVLCGGYLNQGWIPVNKNLWSLSFVLITSSLALVLLSVLYFIIDVRKTWSGRPLLETGMNSIFLYLAHELCHALLPWHYAYGRMSTHFSKLVESSWGIVLWIWVALVLHERKYFFIV